MFKKIFFLKTLPTIFIFLFLLVVPFRVFAVNGWSSVVGPGIQSWQDIASSQDGMKLIAAVYGGYIYTSSDGGTTWLQRSSAGKRTWRAVSSSADGVNLAAIVINGYVYTSNDSGSTWSEHSIIGSRIWTSIASSADGMSLFATDFSSPLSTSTDGGLTWSRLSGGGYLQYDVAVSADGNKVVTIFGDNQNTIYISSDAGSTWTYINPSSCNSVNMRSISMSPDGVNIFIASNIRSDNSDSGWICSSTDGGVTWNMLSSAGKRNWYNIVSSVDGSKLTASVDNGYIYSSIDGGISWTPYTDMSPRNLLKMATSNDGSKIVAVDYGGYIYKYGEVTLAAVTTLPVSYIHSTYATLNMDITSVGNGLLQYAVEYGTTTAYGSTKIFPGAANLGINSVTIGRLTCDTVYHYRALVGTGAGTSYGSDVAFTTSPCSSETKTQILYGVDGSGQNPEPPNLYKIDSLSGVVTDLIGATGHNLTGIAFHPESKILYGVSGGNDIGGHARSLFTVSTTTGVATWMGSLKTGSNQAVVFPDIAFRSDGRLYGFSNAFGADPTTADLYTIDLDSCNGTTDTNCLVVKVGDSDLNPFGNGLVFDATGRLFLFGNGEVDYYELNPDTGAALRTNAFTNIAGSRSINAATLDENGQIYVSRMNYGAPPADLLTINTSDYSGTSTGVNFDFQYMDAIAFDIPTPHPLVVVSTPPPQDSGIIVGSGPSAISPTGFPGYKAARPQIIYPDGRVVYLDEPTNPTKPTDTPTTVPLVSLPPTFTIVPGKPSTQIKSLQQILNSIGFTVSATGPGSPGQETTVFGNLTLKALQKFQCAKLSVCSGTPSTTGYGNVGPKTRSAINRLLVK